MDSLTRKVVRLCVKTVRAPIMRKAPMASATMSSIKVRPAARLNRFAFTFLTRSPCPRSRSDRWHLNLHLVLNQALADVDPRHLNRIAGG